MIREHSQMTRDYRSHQNQDTNTRRRRQHRNLERNRRARFEWRRFYNVQELKLNLLGVVRGCDGNISTLSKGGQQRLRDLARKTLSKFHNLSKVQRHLASQCDGFSGEEHFIHYVWGLATPTNEHSRYDVTHYQDLIDDAEKDVQRGRSNPILTRKED